MAVALAVAAVASVASAGIQYSASRKQAQAVQQTAKYNASADIAQAQQIAMDTNANIQRQRLEDQAYLSKQRAAYAASGILSDTGSPMAVQATTAGRMEMDIQQYWTSAQQKEATLYSAAQEGILEGNMQAEAYHLQGAAALVQGIGNAVSLGSSSASRFQSQGGWFG